MVAPRRTWVKLRAGSFQAVRACTCSYTHALTRTHSRNSRGAESAPPVAAHPQRPGKPHEGVCGTPAPGTHLLRRGGAAAPGQREGLGEQTARTGFPVAPTVSGSRDRSTQRARAAGRKEVRGRDAAGGGLGWGGEGRTEPLGGGGPREGLGGPEEGRRG